MSYYKYKANSDGRMVTGVVEAPNADAAARVLKEKQFFVIEITESNKSFQLESLLTVFKRVGFNDIVNFTRQLSTMVTAGLQLPEALSILRDQTTNDRFADIILDIEHQIVGGSTLADALSKYPRYFTPIYVSLIKAGESSGGLDEVLLRLAETMEAQAEFRAKVKSAMIYPTIIFIGMIVVIILMMVMVVPKLTEMYKDFGATLPWTTQLLMTISEFTVKFWWLGLILVISGISFYSKWKTTTLGEFVHDSIILKIPVWGNLQKKIILVDFTRTFAMLISSGMHILDSLKILKDSMGNVLYKNAVFEIADRVEKGLTLGECFARHDIFPPIISQMVKVGEETGKLDDTLIKVSKYFQSETEHLVKGLTTALEPIIMVILALGVGFIVVSVITPIYDLTNQIR